MINMLVDRDVRKVKERILNTMYEYLLQRTPMPAGLSMFDQIAADIDAEVLIELRAEIFCPDIYGAKMHVRQSLGLRSF